MEGNNENTSTTRDAALLRRIQELEEEQKRVQEAIDKNLGKYFACHDDIWTSLPDSFESAPDYLAMLERPTLNCYKEKCTVPEEVVQKEVEPEEVELEVVERGEVGLGGVKDPTKVAPFSRGRGVSDSKKEIDPENRVHGNRPTIPKTNLFGTDAECALAHIVPADIVCSIWFCVLCSIVVGKDLRSSSAEERFYRTHGMNNLARSRGVKNIPQNFLPLPKGHYTHFDGPNASKLLIVPILDWNEGRIDWQEGEDYWVLVSARDAETYKWIYGSENHEENIEEATEDAITKATVFLNGCTKLLGKTLVDADGPIDDVEKLNSHGVPRKYRVHDDGSPEDGSLQLSTTSPIAEVVSRLGRLKAHLKSGDGRNLRIPLPKPPPNRGKKVMKVRIGYFYEQTGVDNPSSLHPDPLLLGLRAAINWSAYMGQQLLPLRRKPSGEHQVSPGRDDGTVRDFLGSDVHAIISDDEATVASDITMEPDIIDLECPPSPRPTTTNGSVAVPFI